jgi:hypothetical protein
MARNTAAAWLLCVAAAVPAAAQVQKCVDASGKVTFTDTGCSTTAKQAQQVMGAEATSTYDPYAHERTMLSIQRARTIQQETVNAVTQQSYGPPAAVVNTDRSNSNNPAAAVVGQDGTIATLGPKSMQSDDARMRATRPDGSPWRDFYSTGQERQVQAQQLQAERERKREQARAAAAQQPNFPGTLTQCTGAYCYDNQGSSYMRSSDGTLYRNGGGTCTPVPGISGQYNCR